MNIQRYHNPMMLSSVVLTMLLAFLARSPVRAQGELVVTVNTTSLGQDGDTATVEALIASPGADGKISLREALFAVYNTGPGYTIRFDLPHGSSIFTGTTTYNVVQPRTTIDGDSNGDGLPDVLIYRTNWPVSIDILADNVVVKNLAIAGLAISGPDAFECRVENCYIGTDVDGHAAGPSRGGRYPDRGRGPS